MSMATAAAEEALADAGIDAGDVRLLIAGSTTAEQLSPAVAAEVQARIGARRAVAFDVSAACSGFLFGLHLTRAMYVSDPQRVPALVVGTERFTAAVDPSDRSTASIFGDGAGAVVISPVTDSAGLIGSVIGTESPVDPPVTVKLDPSMPGGARVAMTGHRVRDYALRLIPQAVQETLRQTGARLEDVRHFVPHQANPHLIEDIATELHVPAERVAVTGDVLGNTGSASIPLTLAHLRSRGDLHAGDLVLCAAVGAGLSWAGALLRWVEPTGAHTAAPRS